MGRKGLFKSRSAAPHSLASIGSYARNCPSGRCKLRRISIVRYVYGLTAAILAGGAAATLTVGPVGAQTAQNDPGTMATAAPRAGAPMSFADLTARLAPAVVNISTKQTIRVSQNNQLPPGFEEF